MPPEKKARAEIDRLFAESDWAVQDNNAVNLSASRGVAVSELSFTQSGSKVVAGFFVDERDHQMRKVRWEKLDDVPAYDAAGLDGNVVVVDQIRIVLATFREKVFTAMLSGRTNETTATTLPPALTKLELTIS